MFRNKKQNQSGSFEVKPAGKLKKNLILALLFFVLVSGAYLGIKQKLNKPKVSSATVVTQNSDIPGWWFQQYFGSSVCEKDFCKTDADPDQDKLTNTQEYFYHSDPLNKDTNKNGVSDGDDVANNIDPSKDGNVTFDQVTSDENILGESLLFDQDIKSIINEMTDPSKVRLPEVNELELNISQDNSKTAVDTYLNENKNILEKYLPKNAAGYVEQVASSKNDASIAELKGKCVLIIQDMKKLSVPSEFVQIHKYTIMLYELLPDVISVPSAGALEDNYDAAGNTWFDKAQALMTVYQKIDLESKRLINFNEPK